MESNSNINTAKQVILSEAYALNNLADMIDDAFMKAVEMILSCEGRVIFSGIGKPGHIGSKLAATFASTGTPAFFVHAAEAAHGDLGMITSKDLVFLLSHSGSSDELVNLLPFIHRIGAKIIAITSQKDSPIAKSADLVLLTGVDKEADPRGQAPTTSSAAMLALGDALGITVSVQRGFTQQDFRNLHPGGTLGRQK
ncbi:MAG: SIS domain-containing protein [Anaerolineaceae bacterium]|jgi:arabinose-5-phosphate isomerase|nr:MAG: SIS domain-containing protein [Anaerolineaceae bacterium]